MQIRLLPAPRVQSTALLQNFFLLAGPLLFVEHNHVKLTRMRGQMTGDSQKRSALLEGHSLEPGRKGISPDVRLEAEFPQKISHKIHARNAALDIRSTTAQCKDT